MARAGKDNRNENESIRRGERLAAALRENLRRRKAQERGRSSPATDTGKSEPRVPPDEDDSAC
jgi:hypothetical protein